MKLFSVMFVCAVMMLAACGGGRGIDSVLDRADTLMFAAPDSAVRLLDSLDIDRASRGQQARHALLLTKAREKAYVTVTDDSLISIATDYYRGRGDSLEAQSIFYHGVIIQRRGDYSDALISLMEAADLAVAIGDNFYLGMAAREQANIYTKLYEFEQSAHSERLAVEAFIRAGRPLHAAWERVYLAQALAHSGNRAEAYDSIRTLAVDSIVLSNPGLLQEFFFIACNIAYENKDWTQSEEYYNKLLANGGIPETKLLAQMAKVKLRLGDPDGAFERGQRALESAKNRSDSMACQVFLADYYKHKNDYKLAYQFYFKALNSNIALENRLISHPYTANVNDYYRLRNQENIMRKEAAEKRNLILAMCSVIFFLGAAFVFFLYRKNIRQKNLEVQLLLSDLERLRSALSEASEAASQGGNIPVAMLNSIFEAKYTMNPDAEGYNRFGKHAAKYIDSMNTPEVFADLEQFVNCTYNNIMIRFRELCPGETDNYYKVAVLTFAGFSILSISSICKLKDGTIRNMRTKIRNRINASDSADRESLLRFFADARYKAQ